MGINLPDKPSDCLELALKDLANAERRKNVSINMDTYHTYSEFENECLVCLAGSVMIGTLKGKIDDKSIDTDSFGDNNGYKLIALDEFRTGDVQSGLKYFSHLFKKVDFIPKDFDATSYHVDKMKFKREMRKLVRNLRKCGL